MTSCEICIMSLVPWEEERPELAQASSLPHEDTTQGLYQMPGPSVHGFSSLHSLAPGLNILGLLWQKNQPRDQKNQSIRSVALRLWCLSLWVVSHLKLISENPQVDPWFVSVFHSFFYSLALPSFLFFLDKPHTIWLARTYHVEQADSRLVLFCLCFPCASIDGENRLTLESIVFFLRDATLWQRCEMDFEPR